MMEQLRERLGHARVRAEEAKRGIPAARLDGDEDGLVGLRAERDEALRDAEELAGAIDLAAERERRAADVEAEKRRLWHADAAADAAARRLEAAREVDAALAGLAAVVAAYEATGREMATELRGAGRDDSNRIGRNVSPFLRWAIHKNALRCAELLGVPRAQAPRRLPLAELERDLQRSLGLGPDED